MGARRGEAVILRALGVVLVFVTAYVVGRWWFGPSNGPENEPPHRSAAIDRPAMPATSSRTEPERPRGGHRAFAPARPPTLPPRADDDVLEAMMTKHRDAMLMLREAAYYELFQRRDADVAACSAHVPDQAVCWVRFHCALRGQMMELQVEHVDCVVAGAPIHAGRALLSCVRDKLPMREPIGIPAEAASDLGDYAGPLEVAWYPHRGR
jgi:hypothetical protein